MKNYSVVGNKKKVTMEINNTRLKVVGNNCIIRVKVNHGDLVVCGNDCQVEVTDNYGTIHVVGTNGIVTVSKRWKNDNVLVTGINYRLIVNGKTKSTNFFEPQLSPFTKALDDAIESVFTFVKR